MPPDSTRPVSGPADDSSTSRPETPSYLSALHDLESSVSNSVLNLAATLTTHAEDDVAAENLRFLRSPVDPQEEWRAENARRLLRRPTEQQRSAADEREAREGRERLQRVLARLSRAHGSSAYSDRVPNQNSLYDWSPAIEADDDEEELEHIILELRRQQPTTHPEILRVLGRSQLDAERESRNRSYSSRIFGAHPSTHSSESSLRSAAILQSVRRHHRTAARARDNVHRYIADRDTGSIPRTSHDRGSSRERLLHSRGSDMPSLQTQAQSQSLLSSQSQNQIKTQSQSQSQSQTQSQPQSQSQSQSQSRLDRPSRYELSRQAWQATQHSAERQRSRNSDNADSLRIESLRRSYLDNPTAHSSSPGPSSPWFEVALCYISRLRSSNSYQDSMAFADDAGYLTKGLFTEHQEDFVLETASIPAPAESSWLAPGSVLSGSQHATTIIPPSGTSASTGAASTLYRFRNNDTMSSTTFNTRRPWPNSTTTIPPHARRPTDMLNPSTSPQQDNWPVKVTIHTVDYSKMSLTATMEAYNVPSPPPSISTISTLLGSAGPRSNSITTFLEGEILDFTTHTLLTESFKSTPHDDATYWRKLPPFASYTDDELARLLLSRTFLHDLQREWILMRWKERCFVRQRRPRHEASTTNNTSSSWADEIVRTFSSLSAETQSQSRSFAFDPSVISNDRSATDTSGTTTRTSYTAFPSSNPPAAQHPFAQWPAPSSRPPPDQGRTATAANDSEALTAEDGGYGLTISGFYYVALRRSDGQVEGLYCDPQSSPYQHLKLVPVGGGGCFPVWEFR